MKEETDGGGKREGKGNPTAEDPQKAEHRQRTKHKESSSANNAEFKKPNLGNRDTIGGGHHNDAEHFIIQRRHKEQEEEASDGVTSGKEIVQHPDHDHCS